jgi:hypothetical protein
MTKKQDKKPEMKECRKCHLMTDRYRQHHATCRACESQASLARYYERQGRELPLYRLDTTEYQPQNDEKKINLQLWTSKAFRQQIEAAYAIYLAKHQYTKLSNFIMLVIQNGLLATF